MRLIETKFPLVEVNTIGEYESSFLKAIPRHVKQNLVKLLKSQHAKGRNLPKLNNLFYYPARIPASATRAVTLAALVPDSVGQEDFLNALGLQALSNYVNSTGYLATLYMVNPDRDLVKKLVGRDASDVVVVDPMAGGGSIPLEAKRLGFTVIAGDYNPVSYLLLRATVEFPAKYGKRLCELVNKEAKKLIEYVRSELGKYYPEDGKAVILVPADKHECGATVPLVKEAALFKGGSKPVYASWSADEGEKRVWFKPSESPPPPLSVCPFCRRPISAEGLRRRWVRRHKELIERLLQGDESAADEVAKVYQIVAVQLSRGKYREPTPRDETMVVEAARELARVAKHESMIEYLPMYPIPEDNEVFRGVREVGLDHWHYLYTPRQLLTIYKVAKYIRERAQELKRAYGEMGVAVALYMALGFAKSLDYNSVLTQWNASKGSIRSLTGSHYALSRKASLGYDFADGFIFSIEWAFEAEEEEEDGDEDETTAGGMLPVLKLLCNSLEGLWRDGKDGVYMWDAKRLDEYLTPVSVDLVNVDPPYYDQHDYSGITEFFWVVILTALRDVIEDLFPRDRVKIDWDPYSPEVPRGEMRGEPPKVVGGVSEFGKNFAEFLRAASRVLKPDGLLVVWYAYGKLSGWEELFYRFYETGYAVTKTWQVWTQFGQRRVALHTKAFFTSIVIVARPNAERIPIVRYDDPRVAEEASRRVAASLRFILDNYGVEHLKEALVVSLADGIAATTTFTMPPSDYMTDVQNYRHLLEIALKASVNTVLRELLRYVSPSLPSVSLDRASALYLLLLAVGHLDPKSKQIKVPHDFANRVSQVLGADLKSVKPRNSRHGGETDVVVPPSEVAKNVKLAISAPIGLVYGAYERLKWGGVRAAEEYAKEHSVYAPLALALAVLAWDKLGLDEGYRERVVEVLRKAMI